MAIIGEKSADISLSVSILIKKEGNTFIAHCLELDIVAVSETLPKVQKEIISLVCTQIDYAFSNDNIDNLFHPAPSEVWAEFFKCKERSERRYELERSFNKAKEYFVPSSIIANTCQVNNYCRA